MPHDARGLELKVGDRVMMIFEVKDVSPAVDYCNVTLLVPGEHGPENVVSTVVANTKQVCKVSD